MSLQKILCPSRSIRRSQGPAGALIAAAMVLGGCSADIARFDFPSLGVADKSGETGALPKPSQSIGRGAGLSDEGPREAPSGNAVYTPPRAVRGGQDVQVSALPEPSGQQSSVPTVTQPPRRVLTQQAAQPVAPASAPVAPVAVPVGKGEAIEVQAGDTLYGLAKRHKVSLAELTAVNDLKSPNLKPGQKLHLPAGKQAASGRPQKPLVRPTPVAAAPVATATVPAGNWDGTYTVKQGDSLYNIARHHKVQVTELQHANGIADPRKVKPGVVLKVPAEGSASGASGSLQVAASPASAPAAAAAPAAEAPRLGTTTRPTVINSAAEKRVAVAKPETATDAAPAVAEPEPKGEQVASAAKSAATGATAIGSSKLRWPAKGKVIAGFGPRIDGSHNDGINVAVPMGTDVHAAEGGVVAYAGNELKGYGNLVLVRHDNGWVTAYAHAEQMLVKRGDKVRRGQVIAKAGKSGTVDQPQVHFELRQGSKPVDPTPFMEKM